ncbi:unnamed protein product [Amoebophrya sp. A25]|nr:unnamed protein product [Amoebophrya sp. A25]|eukprot:GSA25T00019962001.1
MRSTIGELGCPGSSAGGGKDGTGDPHQLPARYSCPHLLWQVESDPYVHSLIPDLATRVLDGLTGGRPNSAFPECVDVELRVRREHDQNVTVQNLSCHLQQLVHFAQNPRLKQVLLTFSDLPQLAAALAGAIRSSEVADGVGASFGVQALSLIFFLTHRPVVSTTTSQGGDPKNVAAYSYFGSQLLPILVQHALASASVSSSRSSTGGLDHSLQFGGVHLPLPLTLAVLANLLRGNAVAQGSVKAMNGYPDLVQILRRWASPPAAQESCGGEEKHRTGRRGSGSGSSTYEPPTISAFDYILPPTFDSAPIAAQDSTSAEEDLPPVKVGTTIIPSYAWVLQTS